MHVVNTGKPMTHKEKVWHSIVSTNAEAKRIRELNLVMSAAIMRKLLFCNLNDGMTVDQRSLFLVL